MKLFNPASLDGWLIPHSLEWYRRLGEKEGKYQYSWNSTLTVPNGETIFDEKVLKMSRNKVVRDVGCGHGEFTVKCSSQTNRIVGFDVTEDFLQNKSDYPNVCLFQGIQKILIFYYFSLGKYQYTYSCFPRTSTIIRIVNGRKGGTLVC